MTDDTLKRAMAWMQGHDTGNSSKAICAYMLGGVDVDADDYPRDPADLGRCLRLLERCPEWKARMPEMAKFGVVWKALAERWDELAKSMVDEVGLHWEKGSKAPKTYDLMRSIREPAEKNDPNWVDLGNGVRMRTKPTKENHHV